VNSGASPLPDVLSLFLRPFSDASLDCMYLFHGALNVKPILDHIFNGFLLSPFQEHPFHTKVNGFEPGKIRRVRTLDFTLVADRYGRRKREQQRYHFLDRKTFLANAREIHPDFYAGVFLGILP
jgi:hypothetical protein